MWFVMKGSLLLGSQQLKVGVAIVERFRDGGVSLLQHASLYVTVFLRDCSYCIFRQRVVLLMPSNCAVLALLPLHFFKAFRISCFS